MTTLTILAGILVWVVLTVVVSRIAIRSLLSLAADNRVRVSCPEVPSRLVGERLCSKDDWELIIREAPEFQKQFQRDRKVLMLLWLQGVRGAVVEEVKQYRRFARTQIAVDLGVEYRLAADYLAFLLLCEIAGCLVLILSPVRLQATVERLRAAALGLSAVANSRVSPERAR